MPNRHEPASLEEYGRALVERLGGCWVTGKGGLCHCPAHEDRRPSLSVRPGQRNLLIHCFAGCDTSRVIEAVRMLGHALPAYGAVREVDPAPSAIMDRSARARRLWREARPVSGTLAERYLAERGLAVADDALRYHPRTPRGAWPVTCFGPALIAAVRDAHQVVAVHRSFLASDGQRLLEIAEPRMGLGPFGVGAVRLGGVAARLGLAEGLETALSVSSLFGLPCWATLGVERFARVALPPEVRALVLFLDNDAGGR